MNTAQDETPLRPERPQYEISPVLASWIKVGICKESEVYSQTREIASKAFAVRPDLRLPIGNCITYNRTPELETLYDLTFMLATCTAVSIPGNLSYEIDKHFPDSRERFDTLLQWANEFNERHSGTKWGIDLEYMDEIEKFFDEKITELLA